MVFRKFRAETPQHLAFETLMMKKKDLKMKAGEKKYHYQKTWKGQALHFIPIYMQIHQLEILMLPLQQEGEEYLGVMQWDICATYLALLQRSNEVMITVQGCVETPRPDSISCSLRGQWGCDV